MFSSGFPAALSFHVSFSVVGFTPLTIKPCGSFGSVLGTSSATAGSLPLNGQARVVESLVATSAITDAAGARLPDMPFVAVRQGGDQRSIAVNWGRPAKGSIMLKARMDSPD